MILSLHLEYEPALLAIIEASAVVMDPGMKQITTLGGCLLDNLCAMSCLGSVGKTLRYNQVIAGTKNKTSVAMYLPGFLYPHH